MSVVQFWQIAGGMVCLTLGSFFGYVICLGFRSGSGDPSGALPLFTIAFILVGSFLLGVGTGFVR